MNRYFPPFLSTAIFAASACFSQAQVNYAGGVYGQSFNTLPGVTNNTLNTAWTDNSTLSGWYSNKTTFSVTDATVGGTAATFDATSGANNVGLFSFGTAASSDRALGARATSQIAGNDPVLYGVRLVNTSGQTLTKITVTYTGEQWFASTQSAAQTLLVDYQLGASGIASGTWTAVTAATFTAPISTGTTARSLDGNASANRAVRAVVVSGISWAPGQELWIRFRDANESGNEQGLSVDDFYFFAEPESGLFLNGSTSYITMGWGPTVAALNASSFTVECRFMRTGAGVTASSGTGGVTATPLVAKGVGEGDGSNLDANYFLGIDANGKLVADFEQFNATNNGTAYAAGQNFPVIGSTTLQAGVFYHVAATYDTATATWKLYVNGVAETLTQTIATFAGVVPRNDNIQGLGIGTTINSTGARAGFFQGVIDEVRIWNVARSAAEILGSKDTKITSGSGLLARYGFDEATGTTVAGTDAAGAAVPVGTLSGATLPLWSNAKSFVANVVPTVSLTAPAAGGSVTSPAAVEFSADAVDSDGNIAKVEFYQGSTKLGEDSAAPYTFSWTGATAGTYSLTAKAYDNSGASVSSTAVAFTVSPNPDQPPVVTPAGPADGATGIGSTTTVSVGIADPESAATTVTFYGRKTTPATPGADFSIATLPDTQFYSENLNNNGRAATFSSQTQWLLDNRNSTALPNLAFVSHMGDIVQDGDAVPAQWAVADGAMKVLENPATALRAYGIPFGAAPGNHDQTSIGNAGGANVYYNQYFGTARYAGRDYWGGSQSVQNNNNNYQLFSASGLDFVIIHLEYDSRAKSSYQAVLDWADSVLKAFPNRRGIITSHWIVNTGNPASFSTQGQNIYDELKDNPNLFLMLGGHVAGEGRRSDVFEGRTVYSVLQDYQGRTNGGDGWLRYFVLSPANNTITAKTYRVSNPVNSAAGTYETDADSEFVLPYNMQSAVTGWVPLGTVNVPAAGTTADLSWTGLETSSNYEWYATVNDGINTTTTAVRRFATAAPAAFSVSLAAPTAANTGATVTLTATPDLAAGTIARVEFYNGATKLATDTTAPYAYDLAGVASGTYALTAVAVDSTGRAAVSTPVTLVVTNASNVAPTVSLTAPAANAVLEVGAISLTASAADSNGGTITKVEFYAGATKLGEDTSSPYAYTWSGAAAGDYTLTAVATDNDAGSTTSSPVAITLVPAGSFVTSYTQNFDGMGTTGTAPPSAWTIWNGTAGSSNSTWTDATGIIGGANSVTNSVGTMLSSSAALTASSAPTANANNGYNAAAPGDTANRLLATAPTSTNGVALQLELTNLSGAPISAIRVAYDIRRFLAVATANELPGYRLFTSVDSGATWTNAAALNPALSGATVNVPNTVGVTSVPSTSVALGSPWTAGGTLRLRWVDDNAVATSPDQIVGLDNVSITLPIGQSPSVALTAPLAGATVLAPATVEITANASDADGTVSKVEFYNGANKLGEDTTAPYAYTWSAVPAGSYTLTAIVSDNDANTTASTPVAITVSPAPGSGTLARGPYLNSAGPTSIVVRWRTSQSITGRVRYGLSSTNLDQFLDEGTARTDHEVKLTGLAPFTRYYYSVGSAFDTLTPEATDVTSVKGGNTGSAPYTFVAPTAADYTFRTSPVPGTVTPTRIWVVGDCGRGSATQAGGRNAYYSWMGNRVPDFVLMLGDNAYNAGTDTEYQTGYFAMYPTIFRKMPQWSTLGNHDADNGSTSSTANFPYFDMFTFPTAGEIGGVASGTERYHSFDYGNVHVINLDSQTSSRNTIEANGTDGPMAAWLRQDLASTTATWIIVIFHHPPYSKGSHNSDSEGQMVQMRTNFGPILEAGGVDLVLTGHSHNYERSVLLDGHYGISSTITPAMKLNASNGSTTGFTTAFTITGDSGKIRNAANSFVATATVNGAVIPPDGAYVKPLTGPRDHFGAVYNTAGMSGQADGGSIDHAAMYISYDTVGTVNLEINGNTLVATYVQADGNAPDNYTIVKQGAADSDDDGLSDEYEIANGLNRFSATDGDLDLDGDALSNRLEYALDLPANVPGRGALPGVVEGTDTDAGKLRFTFKRAREELTYTVQASDDLRAWSDLAANPGTVGANVTVTDNNTASPHRYLRLRITDGVVTLTTTPVGRMTYSFAQGQDIPVAFILNRPLGAITGKGAGFITGVGAGTLDNSDAGWTSGQLSQAATPHLVRILTGPAAGLVLPVSTATANTATRLTLDTGGLDLTTLGIVPGQDSYELLPGQTLETLFPGGLFRTGASITVADSLRAWNGTAFVYYFHNGSGWQRSGAGGGAAPNTLVRPDQGWILKRYAPTAPFRMLGSVSPVSLRLPVKRAATAYVATLPINETFDQFALQTKVSGWSSNPASPTAGDHVRIWSGSTWLVYLYTPANGWTRYGIAGSAGATPLSLPGRPFMISRPAAGAGVDLVTQPKPY
ncbi:MAG: metallophosphoesterase [Opitutaceae bacterium]|nr:metallophosphoesterase [Opitutaceae bacterium]